MKDAFPRRGQARRRHDRRRQNTQDAIPWLKRCHSREHQVPGSKAELCALDCGQWWSTGGEFCRRGCGGEDGARAELGAGNAERQRGRVKWGAPRVQ